MITMYIFFYYNFFSFCFFNFKNFTCLKYAWFVLRAHVTSSAVVLFRNDDPSPADNIAYKYTLVVITDSLQELFCVFNEYYQTLRTMVF